MNPLSRRFVYIAAYVLLVSPLTGQQKPVPDPPSQAKGYRLDFNEDFLHFDLSPDGRGDHTWYNGIFFSHWYPPNSAIERHPDFITLHCHPQDRGPLHTPRGIERAPTDITTISRDFTHYHAWRYGYFEARMRWKPVMGAFPAFWMIPIEDAKDRGKQDARKETGEIDIFEGQGDRPHDFYATLHRWVNGKDVENNSGDNQFFLPSSVDYSDWHTYGLLWTEKKITWYFDNKPIHTERAYPIFGRQMYYLVLSAQVGSWRHPALEGMDASDVPLDVQWVRVWQKQN